MAISDSPQRADLWLINTCTVKAPTMETLIRKGKAASIPLVDSWMRSSGFKRSRSCQRHRSAANTAGETLKGHEAWLLRRDALPSLDLPKVCKNKFVEIIPINVGCLGACTYCKTKHARGHLGSYTVDTLVQRLKTVVSEGRDIGANIPALLCALVAALPHRQKYNAPNLHLTASGGNGCHPCVYSFLHVLVQSGRDSVLEGMKREYTFSEFRKIVDTLTRLVPEIHIATDVICGFPGETSEDFDRIMELIREYTFPQVHISQFYPRPVFILSISLDRNTGGSNETGSNARSEEMKPFLDKSVRIVHSLRRNGGKTYRVWVTNTAADGIHLVGLCTSSTSSCTRPSWKQMVCDWRVANQIPLLETMLRKSDVSSGSEAAGFVVTLVAFFTHSRRKQAQEFLATLAQTRLGATGSSNQSPISAIPDETVCGRNSSAQVKPTYQDGWCISTARYCCLEALAFYISRTDTHFLSASLLPKLHGRLNLYDLEGVCLDDGVTGMKIWKKFLSPSTWFLAMERKLLQQQQQPPTQAAPATATARGLPTPAAAAAAAPAGQPAVPRPASSDRHSEHLGQHLPPKAPALWLVVAQPVSTASRPAAAQQHHPRQQPPRDLQKC
ncbi:hypothetical protein SELMODRAFT_424054 [Selaginella moellendorffii]|uniref:Radical SAM core domain-containing protein n=1 Tax=Selaginella moellendorffii TaxID=88036 RepID=D8SNN2_SELML|nr:hypothetical protein SELMODRAFT_424054 [Selaginella moellendorffii]